MINSKRIIRFCEELRCVDLNWDAAYERFRQHPDFEAEKPLSREIVTRAFLKLWLDQGIDFLIEFHNDELGIDKGAARLKERGTTKFFRDNSGRVLYNMHAPNKSDRILYDHVIQINSVVTAIDVRLAQWSTRHGTQQRPSRRGRRPLQDMMTADNYNRKLYLIRRTIGGDLGYIIILAEDVYQNLHSNELHPTVQAFLEDGGTLGRLYATKREFHDQVIRAIDRYGINVA